MLFTPCKRWSRSEYCQIIKFTEYIFIAKHGIFSCVCKHARVSDVKVNMQICQACSKNARNLKTIDKKQDKTDQKVFGDKILFKEMPNLLLEAQNVRTSSVYGTHAIEFSVLRPLFT